MELLHEREMIQKSKITKRSGIIKGDPNCISEICCSNEERKRKRCY